MLNEQENSYSISVIITTFNRLNLLGRALSSLENQTFKDFEVIVSDDCSDVDVNDFLNKYKKDSQLTIRYRRNSENKGACYTRNEGIKIARGKYIAGLDDDDEFTPNRLEMLLHAYNSKFSFVSSNTLVIEKQGSKRLFKSEREISLSNVLWANNVGTQVFVERDRILKIGGFDTNLSSAQDADMWIRLIEQYGTALRLKDVTYILHTEHDMPRISTSNKKISGMEGIYEKHKSKMSLSQRLFRKAQIKSYKNGTKLPLIYVQLIPEVFIYSIKRALRFL